MGPTHLILAVDRGPCNDEIPGERRGVSPPVEGVQYNRRTDVAPFAVAIDRRKPSGA